MLLPATCPICRREGPAPCPACARRLRPAPALPPPPGVDVVHALLEYAGGGRELVARLKYRNARSSIDWLATGLAALVRAAATPVDVVTWVPTTTARRRERGFDQAELLGRAVAAALRRPCRPLLARFPGPPQTGRSASARRAGPHLAPRGGIGGRAVLVVDDVLTTGASAAAAARTLRGAGAGAVAVAVAARTPLKRAANGSETCM